MGLRRESMRLERLTFAVGLGYLVASMRPVALALASVLAVAPLAGCSGEAPPTGLQLGAPVTSQGLGACVADGVDGRAHEGYRCVTYRGVGGISMGGGAAMRIALESPELFDVAVSLGSPYIDLEHFLLSVSEVSNGGFCGREQLLANLEAIDEKDDPRTWCGPVEFEELALPGTTCTGFSGDFNHHYRGPDAGRGGSFNREGSFEIVHDFALAYGNPAFYNPESPYLPPGVPATHHVPLALSDRERRAERDQRRRELCASPVRLERFYHALYNPTGEHPVITFCDGNGPVNGEYHPGVANFPFEVALAVDYNDNGRRDYGEPVIASPFEPFDDFGPDGLPSHEEPGYDPATNPDPAGDDYHWLTNPRGTEGNRRHDPGERFHDFGLDGVADTGDFGEGNGVHDVSPNLLRTFGRSPRKLVEELDPVMLGRLHLYADAGIRDFLLSAQITNQFWGALRARAPDARMYTDWAELAEAAQDGGSYDPPRADLAEERVGRHVYLRYGDPAVCPGVDAATGRGNHVGSAREALHRIMTTFAFASARWPGGHTRAVDDVGDFGSLVSVRSHFSEALGREQPYVVMLPPGYHQDPETRYPVIYFLHGQGQKATDLAASALLLLGPQASSEDSAKVRARRADWQKMIIVLADGECQVGECHTGTFYLDHLGLDGQGVRHGEAFFELMRLVDATYRTKAPEMVPLAP